MQAGPLIAARTAGDMIGSTLTRPEKIRIGTRLSTSLIGGGLLLVGYIYTKLQPDVPAVGALLTALAALVVSVPVFHIAIKGFLAREASSFTEQLISLAVLGAMAMGSYVTATLVPLFMAIGHFLEERSVLGARAAIDEIKELNATRATLLIDGEEQQVKPEELKVGDFFIVRPGEVFPADGKVAEGRSSVDQSPVTGESMFEDVSSGDSVYAGTINLSGLLKVEVTGVGADTTLGKVIELLKEAESSQAPISKIIDRYAGYYLPIVLAIAAAVLFLTTDPKRAITVLVVACPCAFVLASPSAMVAALAVASRMKVLIKSTGFLERLSDVETLLLDKTGTITLGRLKVTSVIPADGVSEEELLAKAACCSRGSKHPIAVSVLQEAEERGMEVPQATDIIEDPGLGMTADIGGKKIRFGRPEWLAEYVDSIPDIPMAGTSVACIASDNTYMGYLCLEDRPRPEAKEALDDLRDMGINRMVLVTGDKESVAKEISTSLGFDDFVAEALPEEKLTIVEKEQAGGTRVLMAGDGINDAPALAGSDVGVALCAMVNTVALGSADIAIMTDNLKRLPQIIGLASLTRSIINQNILVGVGFSVLMLALAAMGIIDPIKGAVLHNAGAVFVVLNSARLLRYTDE